MKKRNERSSKELAKLAGDVQGTLQKFKDEEPLCVVQDGATLALGYSVGDFKSLAGSVLTQARDKKANKKVRKALKKLGRGKRGKKKAGKAGAVKAKASKVRKGTRGRKG